MLSKSGPFKFSTVSGQEIKLSDDCLSACRKKPTVENVNSFIFSDQCLSVKDDFQFQIIHMLSSQSESLQFGVVSESPQNLSRIISDSSASLKNSLSLRKNVLYHQNEENVISSEEYDLNLSELCEGDLIGFRITEAGELFFTFNGVACRKVTDNIPKNLWAFVNLNGSCTFISIVSATCSITISQQEKLLKRRLATNDRITDNCEEKVYFHNFCGKEVILTDNNRVAKRKNPTNEFRNAVVISNGPLITNQMFRLRIEGLINKWNGSIELGVTFHNPDMFELPNAMNSLRSGTLVLSGNSILTNGHGTRLPYCTTSLDELKIGDEIGIIRKPNSNIHFFINNADMGIAGNIPVEKDLWVIADLYGRTIKVSIPSDKTKPLTSEQRTNVDLNNDCADDKLVFHAKCGKNVKIFDNGLRACRINDQEFNNGVLFTHRLLRVGEIWAVKLVRSVEQWAGNMEVGLSTNCPTDREIPSTMTDLTTGYTIMLTSNGVIINGSPLSQIDKVMNCDYIHPILLSGIPSLIEGNILAVQLLDNKKIQFFINGADLGIMTLETEQEVYGVLDLYGKAAEVSLSMHDTNLVEHNSAASADSFYLHVNDDSSIASETMTNYQSLLYCKETNDFARSFSLLQSESGLCDALKEADRSFLRLLSGNDELNSTESDISSQALAFHQVHGRNVILTNDGRTAYRPSPNNEFKNALVMSSRPLETDEIFEICVDKMTDHWSGSLEMGVTLNNPVELNFPGTLSQLDKDCWILSGSCIMNNGITARNDYSLDMDSITEHSRIGLCRRRSGMLHFLLDGKDMGAAYFDVPSGIYAILDLYGQCSKVTITSKTGANINHEQNINSFMEISNRPSLTLKEPELTVQSHDVYNTRLSTSRLSPFDRVMLVFKENIPSVNDEDSVNIINRRLETDHSEKNISRKDEDYDLPLFKDDSIFGDGIRWCDSLGFKAENQQGNCVIQSKYPLRTNIYYELIFYMSKNPNPNADPISFGFTAEKFSSQRYLADTMLKLNPPNWIFNGQKLFVDNKLYSLNYASALSNCKKRLFVGVYLHENNSLELFVDRIKVGALDLGNNKRLYMLMNLQGWYDSVVTVDWLRRVNTNSLTLKHSIQKPFILFTNKNELFADNYVGMEDRPAHCNEPTIVLDDPEIDDPIIISILKELYELLPLFIISLKGIETSKLIEKIVVSNNDIVLNVKRDIDNGYKNQFLQQSDIRHHLIDELSRRFSHLTDLKDLGNSPLEIARVLRRKVLMHGTNYDSSVKAFVVPRSCLRIDESKLNRSAPGHEFGLGIINQELKSEKYKSYELNLTSPCCGNDLVTGSRNDNVSLGLIMIETKHFSKAEDVFKFILTIPSPKHINCLSNHINLQLGLFESESPVLVLVVAQDSIFLNERQICQNMQFNIGNMSTEQFICFRLRETESGLTDVYLSIRTTDTNNNHLILSQSLLDGYRNNVTVTSDTTNYLYIPFVWLHNQASVSIIADTGNISQSLLGSSQAYRREWLEKHYNDELNKETCPVQINETDDSNNRLCFSLKRSAFVKSCLSLPETYFKNKVGICFCNSCRTPTVGSTNVNTESCELLIKGDPAKEFRLPLGWVKYNTRLKREVRYCLSLWHLAYLTVSPLLIHRLLASSDPVSVLKYADHDLSSAITWLRKDNNNNNNMDDDDIESSIRRLPIVISPWQPLIGGYINDDKSIKPCPEAEIICYDHHSRSDTLTRVTLEVRVKPNTYQSMESKIVSQNSGEDKAIVVKESDIGAKKSAESNSSRSINQKTVWILTGEPNSVVISGLLIKII